jgi:competence protein ComEC
LLAAALAFCAGDALAINPLSYRPAVQLLLFASLLVALSLLTDRERQRIGLMPTLALWVVAGFWCAELQPGPTSQTALDRYADGLSRIVRGRVVRIRELPARAPSQDRDNDSSEWEEPEAPPVLSFDLATDAIEEVTPDTSRLVPVAGGVRVTVSGDAPLAALRCGDTVEVPLRLRTPERYRDPGAWQYADYLLAQGIGTQGSLPASRLAAPKAIAHRNQTRWTSAIDLRCHLYAAQTWAAERMASFTSSRPNHLLPAVLRLTSDDAGMLNAMLFGDRDRLNHALRLGFERTGSFHLFVVSGMHVALLAAGLFWATSRLRLNRFLATFATIGATTLYALLTGFGAPVQRALLMSSIFLVARLLFRDRNVLNSLGAAVLGVLVLSPSSLFESGFQMTFLAIVAIAGIAVPLGEWSFLPYAHAARNLDAVWLDSAMHPRLAQFRIMLRLCGEHLQPLLGHRARRLPAAVVRWSLWTLELALIGVVAELVMALPMALYFHRATLFALPANVFSIPMVAVLAPTALIAFVASLVSPWLAMLPAAASAMMLHAITGVIAIASHAHGADWRIPGPSPGIIATACVSWAICCWAVRHSRRTAWAAVALLPVTAALVLWPEPPAITKSTLEVTAIDVGQGDSLLVVSPEGRTMLVDAGGPVGRTGSVSAIDASNRFDIGEDVVSPYLWSRHLRSLDTVVLTHAHSDHMGGMPAILRNFKPRELWVGIDPGSSAYDALLKEASQLNIAIRHMRAGDRTDWGGVHVGVLAPSPGYANHGAPLNNDSLVLRLDYGRASALLEGDAEAPSERTMLAAGEVHPVTLLKVGHHGSRTSTTPEFFAASSPREAVVSVGRNNTFGHPRAEVIDRIAAAHTLLYRTDEFGLAQFLLTSDGSIREIGVDAPPARDK